MKVVTNKSDRFLRAPQALMGMSLTEKLIKKRGLEFIDLDPVMPEIPQYQPFQEKLQALDLKNNTPAPASLISQLKELLAEMYRGLHGTKIHPEKDITITLGSRSTVVLLCQALINPGQAVAIPDPGLAMYRLAAVMAGAEPLCYSLLEKNEYLPNLSALFEPPSKHLRLVFLNYPHNPTGAEAESYFYRDLMNQLKYENILIVVDTPFCGSSDPAIDLPLQLRKASNSILELHSFGFPYGIDGLGFAIGHRGAVNNLDQMIKAIGFKPSIAQLNYTLTAIEYHKQIAEEYIKRISNRRKILTDGLKEMGWQLRNSRLTPFVWAKSPAWATSAGFARKLFMLTGVRTRPGTDFGENGEGYLRFSLTLPADKIERALESIKNKPSMYRKRGS